MFPNEAYSQADLRCVDLDPPGNVYQEGKRGETDGCWADAIQARSEAVSAECMRGLVGYSCSEHLISATPSYQDGKRLTSAPTVPVARGHTCESIRSHQSFILVPHVGASTVQRILQSP